MSQAKKATLAALITVLLWSSAFPAIRIGLRAFEPIPLAALRFSLAGFLMLIWLLWRRPALPNLKDFLLLAICAFVGIAGYNILLNSGQRTVSAGAASFIVNTVPVITALLAVSFLAERFRIWAWIGTAISMAGVAIIALGKSGPLIFGLDAFLILAAAVCQATFFILQRSLIKTYGPSFCAASVIVLGAIWLGPWLPVAVEQAKTAPVSALIAVAYLGIFPAAIGYITWAIAQAYFGASRAANFLYLVPLFATGLAIPIANEIPTYSTLIGGGLAVLGVFVVNTRGRL